MAKAAAALALGKNYYQDAALDWGMLTVPEQTPRQRRAIRMARRSPRPEPPPSGEQPCA